MTTRDVWLLLLAWALSGVLGMLIEARHQRYSYARIPQFLAPIFGPLVLLMVRIEYYPPLFRSLGSTWRDRYYAKHKTEVLP